MATSLKTGNARFYNGEGNRLLKQTIPFLWINMGFYVTVKYGSWRYMNFHRQLFAKFSQFIFSTILLESHTIKLDRSTNIMILHANFPTSLFSTLVFLLCNRMRSAISEGISGLTFHSKHQGHQQHRLYLILFCDPPSPLQECLVRICKYCYYTLL